MDKTEQRQQREERAYARRRSLSSDAPARPLRADRPRDFGQLYCSLGGMNSRIQ
jgi:hypothetical protein